MFLLPPRRRPVLRAAISPTFLPAGLSLLMVEGLPICWWLPPPKGCSTGFIATPRTLGQQFLLALYLWYAAPAFNKGLSIRPPPATIPMMARLVEGMSFLEPDGSLTRVLPLSPHFSSRELIVVPSGIAPTGITLPMVKEAF